MSTSGAVKSRAADLAAIVGREHVCETADELGSRAIDGVVPGVVVAPGSAEEIAAVLRVANENAWRVVPVGGGTRASIGHIPEGVDVLLSTARLGKVESYDPGDLTICLGAGARVGAVRKLVGENRQWLPLDVPHEGEATVGGTLASGAFGPMKHLFGGAREFCIGVKFVTGDGRHGKGGGRVVKNVAGYDMMKLMIGSHGTLGVITSANFKLFPAPRQTCTFAAEFESLQEGLNFRNRVVRSPLSPICVELLSPRAHEYLGFGPGERWSVLLRAGGSDAVLARYRRELGSEVGSEVTSDVESSLWRRISDFESQVLLRHANAMLVELHVPASELLRVLDSVERVGVEENFVVASLGRCAAASMALAFIPIAADPPAAMQYANAVSALRAEIPRDGAAMVTRCPMEVKGHVSVWGTPTSDIETMRAIKRALDPANVLNPGRFLF